ncbi:uncharacterized protein si:ch211-217g15.3 [Hippocampus zosterae]|uniref:uncharacterized protein si:ch211-217g15.3 n=1 Tax=Hippocampus zosterae TaxID=109293 RepID=UPI00223D7396|nr:uncharacterized protein si:ch211-217g15.3 [Hippocampus zosterae]
MFRIALLVTLIFGIAAKPYKPWNKLGENAFQETARSEVGNMLLSVEVEPPEEMDQTDDDIDPKMKIWEDVAATGKEKRGLVAEVDLL